MLATINKHEKLRASKADNKFVVKIGGRAKKVKGEGEGKKTSLHFFCYGSTLNNNLKEKQCTLGQIYYLIFLSYH